MDQALKARLIGAVVLVIVAVLVIPELLSGRRAAETTEKPIAASTRESRTITIELGTPTRNATPAAPASSAPTQLPVPGVADDVGPERDTPVASPPQPTSNASKPVVVPTDEPTIAAPPTSRANSVAAGSGSPTRASGRTWSVQVGAFGSSGSAQKLATELEGAGFPAYVASTKQGGKTLHRVRVGPVDDRAEADRLAARLKSRRLPVSVVAND